MKNKKILIGTLIILVIIIVAIVAFFMLNKSEKPEEALNNYFSKIGEQKYEEAYELISSSSKDKTAKDTFVNKNDSIYSGIDMTNLSTEITNVEKADDGEKITYTQKMNTSAGEVSFTNTATLVKEDKEYKLNWSNSIIFPELGDNDKIRVKTLEAERGNIYDRNNVLLAGKGNISSIGLVPGKMSANKEDDIQKLSTILGVSVDSINNKLNMSYVKDDTFVPIKNVATTESQIKEQALTIPGVKITTESSRVYTLGKEASQLIGYVQAISAEELEANAGKGYNSNSLIGKAGIEKAYEDTLRGKDGKEIYIENEDGDKVKTIAKQELENGKDVKLTIDANTQKKVYDSLEENKGAYVAMDSKTGEILALVSTPSYDSNDFVLGMSTDEWNSLNQDENKPLLNRFTGTWSPGSTFKPVTGAIGITEGKIDPNEDFGRSGLSWQKDSSWGNYMVTTLTPYNEPANMQNALIRSDNIYFAKAALKIGYDGFMEGLKKLGFNEDISFELSTSKSTYDTDGKIDDEVQLADSGYGQGQILVNGEDIKQICKEDIDRIFAIVTQVPMAMNGTIRENVDITNTLTDEEIYHYLDLVELKDDIEKFPLGLNTFVGENGQNISGGQKQRIAIARALALKPEVIIFDEATSNLDPLTERRICNNLKQLHITQIVVTHRLNAIQDADTIYVVEKGKIIESGTHVELLQLKGAYYDSVNN